MFTAFYGIALSVPLSAMAEVIIGPDVTRTTPVTQTSGDIARILDNVTINTSGTNSHAIYASNGRINLEGRNIEVITSNVTVNWAYGIYAEPSAGASVSITSSGFFPTIITKGIASYAVIAIGRNANGLESFNLDGINLYTEGLSSAAVMLNNAIGVIKNAYIQTTGSRVDGTIVGAYGMNPQENSTLYAYQPGAIINATQANIETQGSSSYGAIANIGGQLNIANTNIMTHGSSAPGLYVHGSNTDATLSTATAVNTRIEATGLDSSALRIGNSGTLNLTGVTAIASGARSPGLISIAAADAINILSANNSRIISVQIPHLL
ncbi:MAG: hypothetical protein ACRC0M_09670 [Legionella sp.]